MRVLILIFGLLGCVAVVGATARYGFLTSDNQLDGMITAALFAFVATAGLAGHAVAVRIWRQSGIWGVVIGLVSVGAMAVSLTNSLGFVALRGSQGQEQVVQANRTISATKADIARLQAQRDALLPFAPATTSQLKSATDAVATAAAARQAECMRRGNFYREREGDERAAINRQLVTEANLASTDVATDLEAQIKTAKNVLAVTGGERSENTHGKALATLFRLPASEAGAAATIQQAALAILLELVIVACFVAFELLGREVNGRRSADAVIEPTLAAPVGVQLLAPLKLVDSSAVPVGKVSRFFLEETVRGSNARLSMTAALTAYRAWSDDKGLQPVATINFVEAMTIVYREGSIDNVVEGGDIVAVGVKLKTATRPSLRNYQRSPTARLLPQSTL